MMQSNMEHVLRFYPVWKGILKGQYILCVSNDIISEYREIIAIKTNNRAGYYGYDANGERVYTLTATNSLRTIGGE